MGDGSLLAVLGDDNTIFFFEISEQENNAVPVGFVQIHMKVHHISWNDEVGRLLLGLEDGTILELVRPVPEMINNIETYLIELDYRAVLPELPEIKEEVVDEEDDEDDMEVGEDGVELTPEEVEAAREER